MYQDMLRDVSSWQKSAYTGVPIQPDDTASLRLWHKAQYPNFESEYQEFLDAETTSEKIDGVFDTMWTLFNFYVWQEHKLTESGNTSIVTNRNAKYNNLEPLEGIKQGMANQRTFTVLQHCAKQLAVMVDFAETYNYNIDEMWRIGSESNWAKFATNEDDAQATVKHYQKQKVKTKYSKVGEYFIVRVDGSQSVKGKDYPDNKIMKAGKLIKGKYSAWSEPDWSSALPEVKDETI